MDLTCLCVLLACISCVGSARVHHNARVKLTDQGMTRVYFEHDHMVKLIMSPELIWAGGSEILHSMNTTQKSNLKQVNEILLKEKLKNITNASYSLTESFKSEYELEMNEPSLLIDDMLFFTKSDKGLFRINSKDTRKMWPQSTQTEQRFVKLIVGTGTHQDKVYLFFTEKHTSDSRDSESDFWIPKVSQSCVDDKGGPKDNLQNSWTSMIYARIFCGDKETGYDFTQLIDIDTVETDNDIIIYGLFRNFWNMSAVCVYNMTEIKNIFSLSEFMKTSTKPVNPRPGTCVQDRTQLSSELLMFMKERPEMKKWVMPKKSPLLFQHRHYTHIQVAHVGVLFLSLESGGVHKVLEEHVQHHVFVIAEFQMFPQGTHITSMLLDSAQNHLYVSSGNELVQINLQHCDVYGDDCEACVLSRDPYCHWNGSHCSPTTADNMDLTNCNRAEFAESKTEISAKSSVQIVPASARYFLLCTIISRHATYHWYHGNRREECVYTDVGCLYLIESMNATYEGFPDLWISAELSGEFYRRRSRMDSDDLAKYDITYLYQHTWMVMEQHFCQTNLVLSISINYSKNQRE
ncbi:semaphorin-7A-like isoform X2 [Xyrauchen texanus]|uniref:semaphorin-7A-like isoform X2 n=1 Tax=Xyrauchen texanus TaxID=154827 RepID=UPI002241941A|nr:semaphorin-7A-like isoform X2 [Xyrauchen texanus]